MGHSASPTSARGMHLILLTAALLLQTASAQLQRRVHYTTNWAQYRSGSVAGSPCRETPADIPAELITHIIYSFAAIGADYAVKTTEYDDEQLYAELQGLKRRNPALKTLIALGGWSFQDPGPTQQLFGDMVASPANRAAFIQSALAFTAKYGFDGIDWDWEYPGTPDRGGRPTDKAGLTAVVQELRQAASAAGRPGFLISMAVASCPYGCEGTDVQALAPYIDFLNIMSYEYWGTWSNRTGHLAPWVDPLPDADSDISRTLDYYIKRNKLPPSQLNLGLAFYGRGFILTSPAPAGLRAPSFPFQGVKGPCTNEPSLLAWYEIKQLLAQGCRVTIDAKAKAAYCQLGTTWVSFDLPQTMYMKMEAAKALGLGGLMAWDTSLDDGQHTLTTLMMTQQDPGPFQNFKQYSLQVVLSGKASRVSAPQKSKLATWIASFASVPVNYISTETTDNSVVLTWVSTLPGSTMLRRLRSRFETTKCPTPKIKGQARQVQNMLAPSGLKVSAFNFLGTADNIRQSLVLSSVCPARKASDARKARALGASSVAAALAQAQRLVAAPLQRVVAPAGTTVEQWFAIVRGALSGKGSSSRS